MPLKQIIVPSSLHLEGAVEGLQEEITLRLADFLPVRPKSQIWTDLPEKCVFPQPKNHSRIWL